MHHCVKRVVYTSSITAIRNFGVADDGRVYGEGDRNGIRRVGRRGWKGVEGGGGKVEGNVAELASESLVVTVSACCFVGEGCWWKDSVGFHWERKARIRPV